MIVVAMVSFGEGALVLGLVTLLATLFVYQVLCWTARPQATFGMMLAGIYIADLEHGRLTRKRAVGRFFARWLSLLTVGVGFLIQLLTRQRQTLHDKMSGTVMLRGEPAPMGAITAADASAARIAAGQPPVDARAVLAGAGIASV
jgi:uncharacterized RDD family membrane protein YckC